MGFRPFAYRLALELGLGGHVTNDAEGVWCEIEGPAAALREYVRRVEDESPPLAVITAVVVSDLPLAGGTEFSIVDSPSAADSAVGPMLIPADVAPCASCLADIADPADRRFRYPFTCCTDCGPRYTVVRRIPYDRATTSMAAFALCEDCRLEYETPDDRRFHAQATCCPACGPMLRLILDEASADPLGRAAGLLQRGAIVALKGLGGYQLLCRADDSAAVTRLRDLKNRDEKPFAIMVESLDAAHRMVRLDELGERALTMPEAPIVLAAASDCAIAAPEVAPDTGLLGIMLPASPLHALLAADVGVPLVCTSGNMSSAPIVIDDDEAVEVLGPVADAILAHDRRIERRADDSVGQVVEGRFQLLRRARGFAPRSIVLPEAGPPILSVGAELKNTICLAHGRHAGVSAHLGDLENPAAFEAFELAVADQLTLSESTPDLVVHDLHPDYLSTKFASSQDIAPVLGVQHHHAHLVSCLIDNGHPGPAIGVIFDGLGWGTDGTAWGGEFLVGDASGFERVAHLGCVALPGGSAAVRQPWRMAVAHLVGAYGDSLPSLPLLDRHADMVDAIVALTRGERTIVTSSIGRLFDAVAALCSVRDVVSYEGQAAIGLEQLADATQPGYPWPLTEGAVSIDPAPLVDAIVADLAAGVSSSAVSGRFHRSVANMVRTTCRRVRDHTALNTVAISGGVFQNRLLVELLIPQLESDRFDVLRHAQVPPNDAGISLGQVGVGRAHVAG